MDDVKPIGLDLTIVTFVLRYGVFSRDCFSKWSQIQSSFMEISIMAMMRFRAMIM